MSTPRHSPYRFAPVGPGRLEAGEELIGRARERAIANHLDWLAGRMPSEAQRDFAVIGYSPLQDYRRRR